jgi:hypothetical protein
MSNDVIKIVMILALFIGVPIALDLRRGLLLHRRMDRLHLPTEQDINPQGDSYDGAGAVKHFLGKTREQITKEWAEHGHYYEEDLNAMGDRAFCFYLPAVVDYVTTSGNQDADAVSDLCRVIESRLEYHFAETRAAFSEVVRFADYALAHAEDFGGFADDSFGDLRPRLSAIKQKCAEPCAPSQWRPRSAS